MTLRLKGQSQIENDRKESKSSFLAHDVRYKGIFHHMIFEMAEHSIFCCDLETQRTRSHWKSSTVTSGRMIFRHFCAWPRDWPFKVTGCLIQGYVTSNYPWNGWKQYVLLWPASIQLRPNGRQMGPNTWKSFHVRFLPQFRVSIYIYSPGQFSHLIKILVKRAQNKVAIAS